MGQIVDGKFSCDSCGKSYTWKASIAGRKAKCTCGAVISVPEAATPPEDDLYALADAPGQAAAAAPAPMARPVPLPPPIAATPTLAYQTAPTKPDRFSFEGVTHAPRDIYLPVGVLIAGFVAMIAWGIQQIGANPGAMLLVMIASALTTLVKTVILIGIAIFIAPRFGLSFGGFFTAVLKFAGIIIFTDAAVAWLDVIMHALGAAPRPGYISLWGVAINVALTAAFISFFCWYMFDMESEETAMFAIPLAIVSRLIGFLLFVAAYLILKSLLAAAPTAPAAPPGPPGAPGVPAGPTAAPAPPVSSIVETARDRQIAERVRQKIWVREARDYDQRALGRIRARRDFIYKLYGAGAKNVYYDVEGPKLQPVMVYVELPEAAEARAACIGLAVGYCQQNGVPFDPADLKDRKQRFIEFGIKQ